MPETLQQPDQNLPPTSTVDAYRICRPLGEEEFKSKLEMTKAFCETAKSYVQISSAGLALPLLTAEAVLGKDRGDAGLLHVPWSLKASWTLFLISILCGLIYQWLSMRRLWDQYHGGHRTSLNKDEPGYRVTKWILHTGSFNLSWIWFGMAAGLFSGGLYVIYAWSVIVSR